MPGPTSPVPASTSPFSQSTCVLLLAQPNSRYGKPERKMKKQNKTKLGSRDRHHGSHPDQGPINADGASCFSRRETCLRSGRSSAWEQRACDRCLDSALCTWGRGGSVPTVLSQPPCCRHPETCRLRRSREAKPSARRARRTGVGPHEPPGPLRPGGRRGRGHAPTPRSDRTREWEAGLGLHVNTFI